MPEGHTIHRIARRQRRDLAGRATTSSSPQGRFASGASRIDGAVLTGIDAIGKHLFHRFGDETVHVHLGLFGRFRRVLGDDPAPPSENTRWVLAGDGVEWRLSGPTACELLDPAAEEALRARLGPDPLSGDDATPFLDALGRTRRSIGDVLLDQSVIAGVGNVYRAEVLFVAGIDPRRPATELAADESRAVWEIAASQLAAGERAGRIVTVEPADVGVGRRADIPTGERLYVYKRDGRPCRRCGSAIASAESAGRSIWWCPGCQA
jgi:endonuclease-8